MLVPPDWKVIVLPSLDFESSVTSVIFPPSLTLDAVLSVVNTFIPTVDGAPLPALNSVPFSAKPKLIWDKPKIFLLDLNSSVDSWVKSKPNSAV